MSGRVTAERARRCDTVGALLDELAAVLHRPRHRRADRRGARDRRRAATTCRASGRRSNGGVEVERRCSERARIAAAERRARGAPLAYAVGAGELSPSDARRRRARAHPAPRDGAARGSRARRARRGEPAASRSTSARVGRDRARAGRRGTVRPRVSATDVSLDALAVARRERARCAARCCARRWSCVHGSLLGPLLDVGRVSWCPIRHTLRWARRRRCRPSVRDWEPAVALFSGSDGMAATARLVREAAAVLAPGGLLAHRGRCAARVAGRGAGRSRAAVSTRFGWSWISPAASGSCVATTTGEAVRMIEDKAKELGRLIGQSPEYQAVKRASDALERGQGHGRAAPEDGAASRRRAAHDAARRASHRGDGEGSSTRCSARSRAGGLPAFARGPGELRQDRWARVNDWILEGIEKGATSSIITLG